MQHFFAHPLTEEQNKTSLELETFLKRPHRYPAFILTGYAGTGKTSLLGALVNTLDSFKIQTVLLAPTGKAAKILGNYSGKSAFTIHKYIYRRKDKTADYSSIEININLHKNTVFIVDEASMIGDYSMDKFGNISPRNLLEDLFNFVYSSEGCKLILIGDVGQLPPVGSNFSPALNANHLAHYFPTLEVTSGHLTEVLRQKLDSSILFNATELRKEHDDFYRFILRHNGDVTSINGLELQDDLESSFANQGMDETIIVTRSNKRANEFNNQIRSRIFWYEDQLCNGDLLMVVKNNYHWMKDEPKMGFVANGESMLVKRVLKFETIYGFEFAKVIVQFPDYDAIGEQEVIILLETLQSEEPNLNRNRLKELFFAVEEDYLHEKNKKKRYELIFSNPYFNALQVKFGYAVTCHKSQGGQWNHVFIDVGYLPPDLDLKEYNRWLYTALTRAKERAFLINFPKNQLPVED